MSTRSTKPKLKVIPYEGAYALVSVASDAILFKGPKDRMQKYKREIIDDWDKPVVIPKLSKRTKGIIRNALKGLL